MDKNPMEEIKARMLADTMWLRAEFFRVVPTLTAEEIAVLLDKPGEDPHATVRQWHVSGRIFHVTRNSESLYPAFQFGADLHPRPIVGELLTILNQLASRTDWDNAIWFIAANGWLGGPSPLDLLLTEPAMLIHAAEQEVLPDLE